MAIVPGWWTASHCNASPSDRLGIGSQLVDNACVLQSCKFAGARFTACEWSAGSPCHRLGPCREGTRARNGHDESSLLAAIMAMIILCVPPVRDKRHSADAPVNRSSRPLCPGCPVSGDA